MALKVANTTVVDDARKIVNVVDYNGYVPANDSVTITGAAGLTGGGSLSANRTLSLDPLTANKLIAGDAGDLVDAGSGVNIDTLTVGSVGNYVSTLAGTFPPFASSQWHIVTQRLGSNNSTVAKQVATAYDSGTAQIWSRTRNSSGVWTSWVSSSLAGVNGITSNATSIFVNPGLGITANVTGVHVNAGNGLIANTTGVHVNPGPGLQANSTQVFITGASGGGISVTTNEIGVDSTVVRTSGAQTVAGVKTFSSSPIVPTPTLDTQAASKGYVDLDFVKKTNVLANTVSLSAVVESGFHMLNNVHPDIPDPSLAYSMMTVSRGSDKASQIVFPNAGGDPWFRTGSLSVGVWAWQSWKTAITPASVDANIPSNVVRSTRNITSGNGLLGGGSLVSDRTLSVQGGPSLTINATGVHVNTAYVANTTQSGLMASSDKVKLDGVAAGAQVNVATNLGTSANTTTRSITSSTGSTVVLPGANTINAGVMVSADKIKLDGLTVVANTTDDTANRVLTTSWGLFGGNAVSITDWDNALIPGVLYDGSDQANAPEAGLLQGIYFKRNGSLGTQIAMSYGTNVPKMFIRNRIIGFGWSVWSQLNANTNLGYTLGASTGSVTSSTGTSTTLPAATDTFAGLLLPAEKTILNDFANPSKGLANLHGYATAVKAAGTTTLTAASAVYQRFTGVAAQSVVLPDAGTLQLGSFFELHNNDTTGSLTVKSADGSTIMTALAGQIVRLVCVLASGTTAASWKFAVCGFPGVTGSGNAVLHTDPIITKPNLINPALSTQPALVAGTNAQGQGLITGDLVVVITTAANPSGVTLPTALAGRWITVVNRGTNPINVYPALGAAIDAGAANAPVQIEVGAGATFSAKTTTAWESSVQLSKVAFDSIVRPWKPHVTLATTSGTFVDFAIPAGVTEMEIIFKTVSCNGTADPLVQLGVAGAILATAGDYASTCGTHNGSGGVGVVSNTTGFIIFQNSANSHTSGRMKLSLIGNVWIEEGVYSRGGSTTESMAGSGYSKALAGPIDRVRVTSTTSNTFDLGSVIVRYK